jgi:hypothetical protein
MMLYRGVVVGDARLGVGDHVAQARSLLATLFDLWDGAIRGRLEGHLDCHLPEEPELGWEEGLIVRFFLGVGFVVFCRGFRGRWGI